MEREEPGGIPPGSVFYLFLVAPVHKREREFMGDQYNN